MYLAIEDASGSIVPSGSGAIVGCTYFRPPHSATTPTPSTTLSKAASWFCVAPKYAIRSAVNTIERYFEQAYERQLGGGRASTPPTSRVAADTACA